MAPQSPLKYCFVIAYSLLRFISSCTIFDQAQQKVQFSLISLIPPLILALAHIDFIQLMFCFFSVLFLDKSMLFTVCDDPWGVKIILNPLSRCGFVVY